MRKSPRHKTSRSTTAAPARTAAQVGAELGEFRIRIAEIAPFLPPTSKIAEPAASEWTSSDVLSTDEQQNVGSYVIGRS